ncbi:hypothetical protein E5288_WYG012092 [Bos mutus]|uniref:3-oxo-5alpha-steroid 4-dehydrogenase (NADP(+)) n=1 Tax=Bos mutus TaxID=72004 RepID=A0A6B0R576_9CETA|nr:hypothetical protein [Bos mutus]
MPLYAFLLAFIFCTYNGYLQSRYLSQYAVYADDWLSDPRFLTGSALWLIGMLINIHSDHVLRNLRKPGETGYKIPRGGLFEYISAANYFGEVVEWCGYALASWSIQGWAFAVFTFCVLFTRAQQHHKWYHEKFEDYPKFRKIMIPFLGEIVWAKPIPIEAKGVKGKEASGTKFSPKLVEINEPDAEEMAGARDGWAVRRRGEEDLPQTNVEVGMSMMNIDEWKMKG